MADDRISQFEDQPLIADCVYEYTEALHSNSVPIVIDNGNRITWCAKCGMQLIKCGLRNTAAKSNPVFNPSFDRYPYLT